MSEYVLLAAAAVCAWLAHWAFALARAAIGSLEKDNDDVGLTVAFALFVDLLGWLLAASALTAGLLLAAANW